MKKYQIRIGNEIVKQSKTAAENQYQNLVKLNGDDELEKTYPVGTVIAIGYVEDGEYSEAKSFEILGIEWQAGSRLEMVEKDMLRKIERFQESRNKMMQKIIDEKSSIKSFVEWQMEDMVKFEIKRWEYRYITEIFTDDYSGITNVQIIEIMVKKFKIRLEELTDQFLSLETWRHSSTCYWTNGTKLIEATANMEMIKEVKHIIRFLTM